MRVFLAPALAFLCAAAFAAPGTQPKAKKGVMDWKNSGVERQYACLIPPDWQAWGTEGGGMRYGDGILAVSVARTEGTGAAFLKALAGAKPKAAGTVKVSGVQARLYKRQYSISMRGEESRGRETEWIYEEFVLLPARPDGLWVLRFRSPSPTYQESPDGKPAWERFLKGFRLESCPNPQLNPDL